MKLMQTLAGGLLILCTGTALAAVVIKQEPLQWEDVANVEGDALYNNLCASCHGAGGKGDGKAAAALQKHVPDLTVLSLNNDGVYSHKRIEKVIYGNFRESVHGSIDMPMWGEQFMYVRSGWNTFMREAYARKKIHTLTTYIESIQVQ